ncbi:unnamed protein product [Prorocentrum cordatum]|uniref:Uncharacterized protein n=1 Tax=Prorocentrum cordatum TaxID=2364126 RepID=A0ABN9RZ96_9DINO|nr:unnamed protein product [Polarella glacialis]
MGVGWSSCARVPQSRHPVGLRSITPAAFCEQVVGSAGSEQIVPRGATETLKGGRMPPLQQRPLQQGSRTLCSFGIWLQDQELYKKFHKALEQAEVAAKGRDPNGFVIEKAKQLREESDHCANVVRALAGSTLLLVIRLMLADERKGIPWHHPAPEPGVGPWPGSAQQVFAGVASLLAAATPTMDPPFVKPTPVFLTMYAAELLHVMMHQGSTVPAFHLRDDAARAICELWAPASSPCLPGTWQADEKEELAVNFVGALIDLNLSLPPDPEAPLAGARSLGAIARRGPRASSRRGGRRHAPPNEL